MRGGWDKPLPGLSSAEQRQWREQPVIPEVTFQRPVHKELFLSLEIEKYSCLNGRTEEVGGSLGHQAPQPGASSIHTSSPCNVKSIRRTMSEEKPLPCQRGRAAVAPRQAAIEAAPLPSHRPPSHLCQQDPSPQGTFLPLCPPASPRSLLLGALLPSGSESVDLGLTGCVKDHPPRSEPQTPPTAAGQPESPGSYEQVTPQTQQSCVSRDSLDWQKECQGFFPEVLLSSRDNFAGTALPGHAGLGEVWGWSGGHAGCRDTWPAQRGVSKGDLAPSLFSSPKRLVPVITSW